MQASYCLIPFGCGGYLMQECLSTIEQTAFLWLIEYNGEIFEGTLSQDILMCDFEEYIFTCGHNALSLQAYCHQSRNHPRHECHSVKRLRNSWYQERVCNACADAINGNSPGKGSAGPDSHRKDPRGPFVRETGEYHWQGS
ncbi:hypothetical protein MY10362_003177 [Beauveria mimosiformis]